MTVEEAFDILAEEVDDITYGYALLYEDEDVISWAERILEERESTGKTENN